MCETKTSCHGVKGVQVPLVPPHYSLGQFISTLASEKTPNISRTLTLQLPLP